LLVLFFCFLSGWVSSRSCLLISCCYLFIGSSLNSFQIDFICTYGKSSVLLKVLSLPLDSGSILFKQSYDYGLCNDLSFHVGRFLEKEKLASADFNQFNLLLLLPDPDSSWLPICRVWETLKCSLLHWWILMYVHAHMQVLKESRDHLNWYPASSLLGEGEIPISKI
jgi:hypothetical protein